MGHDLEQVFLHTVAPVLERGDLAKLMAVVRKHWPHELLRELLASDAPHVVTKAARCLAAVGEMSDCPALMALLGRAEAELRQAAEDALWSIWMRAGAPQSRDRLAVAIELMRSDPSDAARLLRDIIAADPRYAEAHHQLGVACHLLEQWEAAAQACIATVEYNPHHFAAAAAAGHAMVELGRFDEALEWYQRALLLHPHLDDIRAIVPELRAALHKRDVA